MRIDRVPATALFIFSFKYPLKINKYHFYDTLLHFVNQAELTPFRPFMKCIRNSTVLIR